MLYRQVKQGRGQAAEANSSCACICTGTLVDGTVFFNGGGNSGDDAGCPLVPAQLVQVCWPSVLSVAQCAASNTSRAGALRCAAGDAGGRSLGSSCATATWIRWQQAWCDCMSCRCECIFVTPSVSPLFSSRACLLNAFFSVQKRRNDFRVAGSQV